MTAAANVLVIESPNKREKIQEILGDSFLVMASTGHVKDLPQHDYGIDDAAGFALNYEYIPAVPIPGAAGRSFPSGEERVAKIRAMTRKASMVYLATDPDREGEAIAWHLRDSLGLKEGDYRRVTFDEITEPVVRAAMAAPRTVNMNRVAAQEARRALDRMVGWHVSPLLRDALGVAVSAGRVQSPAVRLVVEREAEIARFRVTDHFGAAVEFDGARWKAQWNVKPHLAEGQAYLLDGELAKRAAACRDFVVTRAESKPAAVKPPPPFSTSAMLRGASVSLQMSLDVADKLAKKLFEAGHINYPRVDSLNIGATAVAEIRALALTKGWKVPDAPRRFKGKANAQEAHEAMRPTHFDVEEAGDDAAQRALYKLIWQRAVASQLADALYTDTALDLEANTAEAVFEFKAKGRVLVDRGWRVVTDKDATEDSDDAGDKDEAEDSGGAVPRLTVGSAIHAESGKVLAKKTRPPSRFTEASLVEKLEAVGIGRPSTFVPTVSNIMRKGYVREEKRFLHPTKLGVDLCRALMQAGFGFIEIEFTRGIEEQLDLVEEGKTSYLQLVSDIHRRLMLEIQAAKNSGILKPRFPCPLCGRGLSRSEGKHGAYWTCAGYREGCPVRMDDVNGLPVPRQSVPCTVCGKELVRRSGELGHFWSCTGYKEGCENRMDDENGKAVPRRVFECPVCTKPLRRLKGPEGIFWRCTGYKEGCKQKMDDVNGKPVPKKVYPCPKCKKPLNRIKGPKGFFWGCSDYDEGGCRGTLPDSRGKPGSPDDQGKKTAKKRRA